MHIHGNSMNIQASSFYAVGNGEPSAAQRAAEVRKKLLKHASSAEAETTPEESLLIGHWLDSCHGQALDDDEYHANQGNDPDFG